MNIDWKSRASGVRAVLIFFLGLNIAWMETCVNAIVAEGSQTMLGWPPFGWYMTALDWFWTHFVLTILTTAALIYIYETTLSKGDTP